MTLTVPESMEDCLYFSNRSIGEGNVMAWVYRKKCPECKKAMMGKPVDVKTGNPKSRATVYVCPECKYEEGKSEHEASCELQAQYTCPHCGKDGEGSTPYVRKSYMGTKAFIVECKHCSEKIAITKKLKEPKKKKSKK